MDKWTEQTFSNEEIKYGHSVNEWIFNSFNYQGNANTNYIEISSHSSDWEVVPGMRGGEIKENDGGGEFSNDIL
jgi:hypothetical protein